MATIGLGQTAVRVRRIRWPLTVAALLLLVPVAVAGIALVGLHVAYSERILPGVRVGSADLGGLDREAARVRLEETYAGLVGGEIVLTGASSPIRFALEPVGRRPESEAALDEAFGVGRGSNPVETGRATVQLLIDGGRSIPPTVVFDDAALREVVAELGVSVDRSPVDARVELEDGRFTVLPAVPGRRLDRESLLAILQSSLARPGPLAESIALRFAELPPSVSTAAAERARATAERFVASPLVLTLGEEQFAVEPTLLRSWIRFLTTASGTVTPTVDGATVQAWLSGLTTQVDRPAVDAGFVFGSGRVRAVPAEAGRTLNVAATVLRIEAAIANTFGGDDRPASIGLTVDAVSPRLATDDAEALAARMDRISEWTTRFIPSERNGFGANIRVPAKAIDGTVIMPGEVFDYWEAVGEVSRRTGFRQGAAIINGKTEPQGAFAGGICTSSTTMFNAAARAGYEILDRRAHFYYIDRYPLGLDATVFKTDGYTQTMAFRNDTPYPLLVRGLAGPTWTSFEIWSVPTGRTVTFSRPIMSNHREATSGVGFDPSKPAGYQKVVEVPTAGMDVSVTRTVQDSSGAIVHRDTWFSRYRRIDGLTVRGGRPS